MEEPFDPYLQWLAIRDPKRPPNHYRLLGLDLFESDLEVIQNAADRQMTHIRRFQGGKHSAESQKLLNELATAKVCLLQPEKKTAYDAALRVEVQPEIRVTTPPPLARGREVSASPPPLDLARFREGEAPAEPNEMRAIPTASPARQEPRPPSIRQDSKKSSTEEVLIPSRPLAWVDLHDRPSESTAATTDRENKPRRRFLFETKFSVYSISFYLSILAAAAAILIGLFVLLSNAKKTPPEETPAVRSSEKN